MMSESPDPFFEKHEPLLTRLHDLLEKSMGDFPAELHHYTDAAGVLGILERGELWASDALFLNDAEELEAGIKTYENVIEGLKGPSHSDRVQDLLTFAGHHGEMLRQSAIFVCCLSAAANQLSQWRAYSGSGTGYSIGFDFSGLLKLRFDGQPLQLRRVLYNRQEQGRLAFDAVICFGTYIDLIEPSMWEAEQTRLNSLFIDWVHPLIIGMKLESFREEQEWRLFHRDVGALGVEGFSFRTSKSGLIVPYCPLARPDHRLPITRVIVGPTNHPEIAVRSMRQLLKRHGYEVDVQFCNIPFRAL